MKRSMLLFIFWLSRAEPLSAKCINSRIYCREKLCSLASLPTWGLTIRKSSSDKLLGRSKITRCMNSLSTTADQDMTRSMGLSPFKTLRNFVTTPFRKVVEFFTKELPMLFYIWPSDNIRLRIFLVFSMLFMFVGKWFNVKMPFILQSAIDTVSKSTGTGVASATSAAKMAIIYYGVSRALSVIFSEFKTCLFAYVSQNALRKFARSIFAHLHTLDSEFHLETPSGVISVAYVRAVRGFQTMLFQLVFSVAPTLLELLMVSHVLYRRCGPVFAGVTLLTFSVYLAFTVWVTQYRIQIRQELVDVDNARNGFFIDSILNHEVVKLFTSEQRETQKFDGYLQRIEKLSIDSTFAIAILNLGQAALFGAGLTSSLLIALHRVGSGLMSVGDLVAVNSMLLQLSIPFNVMGFTYQELRQSFVDMEFMRDVLCNVQSAIKNDPKSPDIETLMPRTGPSTIEFRNVSFSYGSNGNSSAPLQELLKEVSFKILPGQNAAIVGPSGSGKSTTLRLITRMLDPLSGQVLVDGVDVRKVSLDSLRKRVAVVPQDNSLFDDTVEYNIRYGNMSAPQPVIDQAIEKCNLGATIEKLKYGLNTQVGERGARLSGGERQKVSIARALLKDPTLILCDEVTSAVDAFAERDIVDTLRKASEQRTTLTVAHRLSSIAHCDIIIVMEKGRVIEKGTHPDLLKKGGVYANMWAAQTGGSSEKLTNRSSSDGMLEATASSSSSMSLADLVVGGGTRYAPVFSTAASLDEPPEMASFDPIVNSLNIAAALGIPRRDVDHIDGGAYARMDLGVAGVLTKALKVSSPVSLFHFRPPAVTQSSSTSNTASANRNDSNGYEENILCDRSEADSSIEKVQPSLPSSETALDTLEEIRFDPNEEMSPTASPASTDASPVDEPSPTTWSPSFAAVSSTTSFASSTPDVFSEYVVASQVGSFAQLSGEPTTAPQIKDTTHTENTSTTSFECTATSSARSDEKYGIGSPLPQSSPSLSATANVSPMSSKRESVSQPSITIVSDSEQLQNMTTGSDDDETLEGVSSADQCIRG